MAIALGVRRWGLRRPSAARLGDWALALIWVGQGAINATSAFNRWRARDYLAAAHISAVSALLLLYAALVFLRKRAAKRGVGVGSKIVALIGTWSIVALSLLPLSWRPDWLLTATTVLLIAAYGWIIWTVCALRRNLSVFPEARQLVRHGPYQLVRHPLYSAHIACYVLVALPRLSPWALLLMTAGIAAELLRARGEERLLTSFFPDYAGYAATTPRFLPRLDVHHAEANPSSTRAAETS